MYLSKQRVSVLHNCHLNGWKVKKIAEVLTISPEQALLQMNVFLDLKYGSNDANISRR